MEHTTTHIKRPADSLDMSRFRVGGEKVTPEYEHYVHLTAKLIKRSYIATAKLVEAWPTEKIIRRYEECTKHITSAPEGKSLDEWRGIMWWTKRKRELST